MIVKKKQKGETEVNVPNWVVALVAIALILLAAVLLTKYLPAITIWLI